MPLVSVPDRQRHKVFQLPVDLCADYPTWLGDRMSQGQGAHVITINAEMAMQAEQDPELGRAIREADLVIPDGAGVVWYLRLRGRKVRRSPGIELAADLICQAASLGWQVFFFGGAPGVAAAAAQVWQQQYPTLKVAGVQHGFLSDDERSQLLRDLETKQPQLILVGLGVPRQEFWIREHRHLSPQSIWMGIGGSFDVWSGQKQRAPRLLQQLNLEWTWRLIQEPWRWRRMLALPRFAWRAVTDWS